MSALNFFRVNRADPARSAYVLVVDDEPAIRELLTEWLQDHRLEVVTASNGLEALNIVKSSRPDLVLLDARMPVMDGFETCAQLRALPATATVPILMITGFRDDKSVERAFAAGANDVLPKPISLTLLTERILHLLSFHQQAEALRTSEARYRLIVETAQEGVWLVEPTGQTLYANARMSALLGSEGAEVTGRPLTDFMDANDAALLLADAHEQPLQREICLWRADGQRCWALISASPLVEEVGQAVGILMMVTDIHARKEAEERLRESEGLLREAQRVARLGGWFRRLDSDRVTLTGEIHEIYDFPRDQFELPFAQIAERIHPDDRARVTGSLNQVVASKGALEIQYRIIRPNGEERVLSGHGGYVKNARGEFLVGSTRDITEQVRAEEALRLRDQAIAATTSGILLTDARQPDNPIVFANPAFTEITGYSEQEVLGGNCRFLQGPESDPATVAQLREAIARGRPINVEIRNYRKDGTPFWNALSISPIHDTGGHLTHFVGIQQDVTARKLAEEEMQRSEERFAAIFFASPVAIAISSLRHSYAIEVNPSFLELFGRGLDEVKGQTTSQMNLWAVLGTRERILEEVQAKGYVHNMELQARHRDGSLRYVLYSAERIELAGEPCLLSYCRDITTRKQAELALLRLNQQLTETLESTTDAFYALDHAWRFVHLNQRAVVLLRQSREELLGENMWERFPDAVGTSFFTKYYEAITKQLPVIFEEWYEPLKMWVEVHAYPTSKGLSVYFRDITEAHKATQILQEREMTLNAIFTGTLDAILITDDAGRYVDANPAACKLFGMTKQELLGRSAADFVPPAVRPRVVEGWGLFLAQGTASGVYELTFPNGQTRILEYTARAHFLPGRHVTAIRDVADRVRAERAVQASEEYMRALVENLSEAITVIDAEGRVRYASPAQQRMLGYQQAVGLSMFARVHPDEAPRLPLLFEQVRMNPAKPITVEIRAQHVDGSWRVIEATATNLLDNPAVRGIVVNSHDITERKAAEALLLHNAFHDALTGLPNRALFLDRLEHCFQRAKRNSHDCAVLFIDLDRFKNINDSLGHIVGDQLLIEVSKRLLTCVRAGDTVARFGGDEFAILLDELKSDQETIDVAEKIVASFKHPFYLAGQELVSHASIGIALCFDEVLQPEEMLRDADIAMYKAKHNGQAYAIADPAAHATMLARLEMEADLRRALEREEFVLHYQPKLSIDGSRVLGVEALVRWQHPERGMIPPGDFISLAEETGLIVPLGQWVLRHACQQMRQWLSEGISLLFVAVNISARQFQQPTFVETVRTILAEVGLDPGFLCAELTESLLMVDAAATIGVLGELRGLGLRALAVDDFGTGYSSLSYLQRFPVTELKIDRSFVQGLPNNRGDAALVTSIIALAHSLDLHVIAEGVETEAQRGFLEAAGCDRFQGYLASRPLPAEQLVVWLRSHELLQGAAPA